MALQKIYSRINWENYPSEVTPINESNLNRMDYAIDELDDRVITLDTTKATVTEISTLIESIDVDDATGDITITKQNGATVTLHTTIGKIAVNFNYDYATQTLILTMNDGTTANIDLSALIQNNEFDNTNTINLSVSSTGHVSADVIQHSIGDEHLRTNYLADIRVSEANAAQSEASADAHKLDSEAWAVGERGGVPVGNTDDTYENNAKYYAEISYQNAEAWADGQRGGIDVPSTDPTYKNNASYWRKRAEAWAVGKQANIAVDPTDETYENNSKYYSEVSQTIKNATQAIRDDAATLLQAATDRLTGLNIMINFSDGHMYYDINSGIRLQIDNTTGNLMYDII